MVEINILSTRVRGETTVNFNGLPDYIFSIHHGAITYASRRYVTSWIQGASEKEDLRWVLGEDQIRFGVGRFANGFSNPLGR